MPIAVAIVTFGVTFILFLCWFIGAIVAFVRFCTQTAQVRKRRYLVEIFPGVDRVLRRLEKKRDNLKALLDSELKKKREREKMKRWEDEIEDVSVATPSAVTSTAARKTTTAKKKPRVGMIRATLVGSRKVTKAEKEERERSELSQSELSESEMSQSEISQASTMDIE